MKVKELQNWIRENLINDKGHYINIRLSEKYIQKHFPTEYSKVIDLTKFLDKHYDNNVKISQRLWHIDNNSFKLEYCKWCENNITKFNGHGYNYFCCKECQNKEIGNRRTGKNNPYYKHGLKNKGYVYFDSCKYLSVLDEVTEYRKCEEDGSLEVSCQWCGKWYKIKFNILYNYFSHRKDNPNHFLHCSKQCKLDNPLFRWNGKFGKDAITYFRGGDEWVWYDTYSSRFEWIEETNKETETGALLVKCYHCEEWFRPTKIQVWARLNGMENGTCNFYCSEQCKNICPVYKSKKFYKHSRPYENNHINEVHPEVRDLVFKRDNHECQICGKTEYLICHHIDPIANNPIESADIDNCITLCRKHHEEVHKLPGCSKGYLSVNCNLI